MTSGVTQRAKDKLMVLAGLILFLLGTVVGVYMRPDIPSLEPVMETYAQMETQFSNLAAACARPQQGTVTITGEDIVDAVRNKQLRFIVNTETVGGTPVR